MILYSLKYSSSTRYGLNAVIRRAYKGYNAYKGYKAYKGDRGYTSSKPIRSQKFY